MHIDLHTHSTASDGLLSPAELIHAAHEARIDVLALTDHDSTEGVAEAMAAAANVGIEVIPGIEINTDFASGGEAHVLGYFLHWQDAAFQQELRQRRDAREARGRRMVERLRAIGVPITWEMVRRYADGAVGRPHVAAALIEIGAATSVGEAFAKYLSRGKPGYVPRAPFTPEEAIALIRSAGGFASLAHPLWIADPERSVPPLVAAGLEGLEVYYGEYGPNEVARLRDLACRWD